MLLPGMLLAQAQKQFNINIKMTADESTKIYLAYQIDGRKIIDSAIQKNGEFNLSGAVAGPLSATLVANNSGLGIQKLLKVKMDKLDAIRFYIHPGNINVKAGKLIANATLRARLSILTTKN